MNKSPTAEKYFSPVYNKKGLNILTKMKSKQFVIDYNGVLYVFKVKTDSFMDLYLDLQYDLNTVVHVRLVAQYVSVLY